MGCKKCQFDDQEKYLNATKFDNVEDLQAAIEREKKLEELKKKSYRPE